MDNNATIQVLIQFVGHQQSFPATHFTLKRVASEYILTFFFDNGTDEPDLAITICMTANSVIHFYERCIEILNRSNLDPASFENFSSLIRAEKESRYADPPKRINAVMIARSGDLFEISGGFVASFLIPKLEIDQNASQDQIIKVPSSFFITVSIELFIFLFRTLEGIKNGV